MIRPELHRRSKKPRDKQYWECEPRGHRRMKFKPGASVGSMAVLRCGECGERVKFTLVEVVEHTSPFKDK